MSKMFFFISYLTCLVLIPKILTAQYQKDKSIPEFKSKIDTFYNSDFVLKNGRYYIDEYPRVEGNPFFLNYNWVEGELKIQNKIYQKVKLNYDICNQKILCAIIGPENIEIPIKLNNELISGFQIENHRFENYLNINILPQNGFYEILYLGNQIQVYAKWSKAYQKVYTKESLGSFDKQKRTIYMVLDNKNYSIIKNKDFLSIFPAFKKQINSYMRQHHIKLSKINNDLLRDLFKYSEGLIINNSTK